MDDGKHACPVDGSPLAPSDRPPYADPGRIVRIGDSGEYGRVRLAWNCCGTFLVERLDQDERSFTNRYSLDSLSAPAWGDCYSVPCAGSAWSLDMPCGHIAGEGCGCTSIPETPQEDDEMDDDSYFDDGSPNYASVLWDGPI